MSGFDWWHYSDALPENWRELVKENIQANISFSRSKK